MVKFELLHILAICCILGKATRQQIIPSPVSFSISDNPQENCVHTSEANVSRITTKVLVCFGAEETGISKRPLYWRRMTVRSEDSQYVEIFVRRLPLFTSGATIRIAGSSDTYIANLISDQFPELLVSYFNGYGNSTGGINSSVLFTGLLNISVFDGQITYINTSIRHKLLCPHENSLKPDFYQQDQCLSCSVIDSKAHQTSMQPLGWRDPSLPPCKNDTASASSSKASLLNSTRHFPTPPQNQEIQDSQILPPASQTESFTRAVNKGSHNHQKPVFSEIRDWLKQTGVESDENDSNSSVTAPSRTVQNKSVPLSSVENNIHINGNAGVSRNANDIKHPLPLNALIKRVGENPVNFSSRTLDDDLNSEPTNNSNAAGLVSARATSDNPKNVSNNDSEKTVAIIREVNYDVKVTTASLSENGILGEEVNSEEKSKDRRKDQQSGPTRKLRSANENTSGNRIEHVLETVSCSLHLVADHLFFTEMGDKSASKTVSLMLSVVIGADAVFRSTDFDNNGFGDNIGFMVKNITIIRSDSDSFYRYSRNNGNAFEYLKNFSTVDFSEVCLGVAFTAVDFERGVVGLAWYTSTSRGGSGKGGICGKRVFLASEGRSFSFNTAIVTFINHGTSVSMEKAILTLAHEFGHCFGSGHDDSADSSCDSEYQQSSYLMQRYRPAQYYPTNFRFSPCSIRQMYPVIQRKGSCLDRYVGPACGNGVLEEGEECDCGLTGACHFNDPCCTPGDAPASSPDPPCTVRRSAGMQCSPVTFSCCSDACMYINASAKYVCREQGDCYNSATCDGLSPRCPASVWKPDGSLCHGGVRSCSGGRCSQSLCRRYGLKDCFCTDAPLNYCKLCCRQDENSVCQPVHYFNTNLESPNQDVFLPDGDACLDFRGVCSSGLQWSGEDDGSGEGKRVVEPHTCITDNDQDESFAPFTSEEHSGVPPSGKEAWLAILLLPVMILFAVGATRWIQCCSKTMQSQSQRGKSQHSSERFQSLIDAAKNQSDAYKQQIDKTTSLCNVLVANVYSCQEKYAVLHSPKSFNRFAQRDEYNEAGHEWAHEYGIQLLPNMSQVKDQLNMQPFSLSPNKGYSVDRPDDRSINKQLWKSDRFTDCKNSSRLGTDLHWRRNSSPQFRKFKSVLNKNSYSLEKPRVLNRAFRHPVQRWRSFWNDKKRNRPFLGRRWLNAPLSVSQSSSGFEYMDSCISEENSNASLFDLPYDVNSSMSSVFVDFKGPTKSNANRSLVLLKPCNQYDDLSHIQNFGTAVPLEKNSIFPDTNPNNCEGRNNTRVLKSFRKCPSNNVTSSDCNHKTESTDAAFTNAISSSGNHRTGSLDAMYGATSPFVSHITGPIDLACKNTTPSKANLSTGSIDDACKTVTRPKANHRSGSMDVVCKYATPPKAKCKTGFVETVCKNVNPPEVNHRTGSINAVCKNITLPKANYKTGSIDTVCENITPSKTSYISVSVETASKNVTPPEINHKTRSINTISKNVTPPKVIHKTGFIDTVCKNVTPPKTYYKPGSAAITSKNVAPLNINNKTGSNYTAYKDFSHAPSSNKHGNQSSLWNSKCEGKDHEASWAFTKEVDENTDFSYSRVPNTYIQDQSLLRARSSLQDKIVSRLKVLFPTAPISRLAAIAEKSMSEESAVRQVLIFGYPLKNQALWIRDQN